MATSCAALLPSAALPHCSLGMRAHSAGGAGWATQGTTREAHGQPAASPVATYRPCGKKLVEMPPPDGAVFFRRVHNHAKEPRTGTSRTNMT